MDSDVRETISAERIDFHEGICWPQTVSVIDERTLRLDARCEQEDSSWQLRQEWNLTGTNEDRRLSMTSLDPERPGQTDMALCSALSANIDNAPAPARSGPLPFPDGRYVTDKALCGLSEQEMLDRHGDMLGTMVRIIDGPRLTNAYEMSCTVSGVRSDGDSWGRKPSACAERKRRFKAARCATGTACRNWKSCPMPMGHLRSASNPCRATRISAG
jgi:hypothetical protein